MFWEKDEWEWAYSDLLYELEDENNQEIEDVEARYFDIPLPYGPYFL